MKKYTCILGAVLLLVLAEPLFAQSVKGKSANTSVRPSFNVDSFRWTDRMEGSKPTTEINSARVRQSVYLWVSLSGEKDALDLMKEVDHPVSFKWFRNANYGLTPESSDVVYSDEPEFVETKGASRTQWLDKKRQELKKENRFRFSAWSGIPALKKSGEYVVKLVYSDNLPVYCNGGPCEFKITIR
jgi:hypothetical protein